MRRTIAAAAICGSVFACERVCGDLEPLSDAGVGSPSGGSTGLPPDAGGMGGDTTTPGGAGGAPSECSPGVPDAGGVLLIADFETDPMGVPGSMASEVGEPEPQASPGTYTEQGFVGVGTSQQFTFDFLTCVDASAYQSVQFEYSGGPDNGWTITFAVVTPAGATDLGTFQPGDGRPVLCVPFEPSLPERSEVTALRWSYAVTATFGTDVSIEIDNVAFTTDPCGT